MLGKFIVYGALKMNEPSISSELSRSMRKMRPVERARISTLLAT